MSLEEDSELRDLVVKSLESNGILAKLKAQLRASIFIALEEENSIQDKIPYTNNKLKNFLEHKQGKLLFLLIKDTLEYFDLDYTKSVFDAETRLNDSSLDHSDISKEFNIETTTNEPLFKIVSSSPTVSDKLDKVKPFSSLSSLGDLPPLNINKNRNDPILLPSLYSKERKYSSDSQSCDESIDMDNIKSHSS
ncbi:centrosomal protein 43-like [Chrysoperla carnea]|uniref:centrosomal protein 43-like n=1 Tax=Chrysoperla carnea TaxID=189513 RepID=UPI001D062893|nr:centrosomal protein 43-like [Chrysoperla carnea]